MLFHKFLQRLYTFLMLQKSLQDYLNKQRGLTRRKFGGIAIKGVKEKISIT